MDVQLQVWVVDADVGAVACLLAELVHDSILHLIGHELAVAELVAEDHAVNGECCLVTQIFRPIYLLDGFVHLIGAGSTEMLDGFQNANSGAQLEVGTVQHLLVACKADHSSAYLYIVGTKVRKFLCQYFFKTLKGLCNHFKLHENIILFLIFAF